MGKMSGKLPGVVQVLALPRPFSASYTILGLPSTPPLYTGPLQGMVPISTKDPNCELPLCDSNGDEIR